MFQKYSIYQAKRVQIIKNWPDRQGLELLEAVIEGESL